MILQKWTYGVHPPQTVFGDSNAYKKKNPGTDIIQEKVVEFTTTTGGEKNNHGGMPDNEDDGRIGGIWWVVHTTAAVMFMRY